MRHTEESPMRWLVSAVLVALSMGWTANLSGQSAGTQADPSRRSVGDAEADRILRGLDAKRATYADVAKQIWAFAEVGYQEQKSSALLQQQLRAAGFSIRAGVAEIPTAFV